MVPLSGYFAGNGQHVTLKKVEEVISVAVPSRNALFHVTSKRVEVKKIYNLYEDLVSQHLDK
jgi:hypothetical protein